jgi:4-amino-4-deoxychorismate lyase
VTEVLRILVNGIETQQVSALDRGLHYGDGVFRSLRVEQGRPCDWSRQVRRLYEDAARIGLTTPDVNTLTAQAETLCSGHSTAVLKLILTRGPGARGYGSFHEAPCSVLLLYPMPEFADIQRQDGIQARICETRLSLNARLAGVKHLNRLEQVLARNEWDDAHIKEGLMLDTDDHLIEGVSSNLFLVRDGELLTPDLSLCGVAGVTREMILEAAPAYTKAVQISILSLTDINRADECFVCNSVMGIRPITQLGDRRWSIGPVTRTLQRHFEKS